MVLAAAGILVLVAAGGAIWWYAATPHTPEAQFARASALEKMLRSEAVTKTPAELASQIDAAEQQYRLVETRFGKTPKAAEALQRIAKIDEELAKDPARALATLGQLEQDFPGEQNAGFALREEARLIRAQAEELKSSGSPDAVKKYQEALAKLDQFRKTFAKSADADAALMEIGRIWQDGIEEPPIKTIETFETFLKDYPDSTYAPEAMYRLGKEYEKIGEKDKALALYEHFIELYPKDKYAADVTMARGRLLEEMGQHEQAAQQFEKMQQEFPDDPRAQAAGSEARSEQGAAEQDKNRKYGQSRYGGTLPYDTTADKPLPPAEMMARYTAEKLHAEDYDLDVTFTPAEHRIAVKGTLKLVNHGEDKTELLLMLGSGLKITELTVDGAKAKAVHVDEAIKITLPAVLKKDAETTLAFAYSGQYTDAAAIRKAMSGELVHDDTPATAPASAPASAPAGAAASSPASAPAEHLAMNPQMALGDYGYGLSGACWYPLTIIGDVSLAHLTIHTPANVEAVSNGALVKREKATQPGKESLYEFRTANPIFGLYFAYGPYVEQEKQIGPIHFYSYLRPENAKKSDAYFNTMNGILSFYAEKFAPFPYEKMAVIDSPLPPILGGVGPSSMMFLQDQMVDHPEVPENLLAHELAHQWFGNLIPVNIADKDYSQWLSEGFATYCDALYTEHKDGEKAFALHLLQYQQLYFQFIMMAPKGSGAIRDTTPGSMLYRPVVYEKGALVLHMLRKVMGDDKFFQLMRQYVETCRNKDTTTDDFCRLASTVYGQDLSWFFSEWFDQSVFAHWTLTVAGTKESGGGDDVAITIRQPDDLVKMPVDITEIGPNDERHVDKNVMLDQKEQHFETHTPFVPVKVVIDEDNWVLKRLGSDNIWQAAPATAAGK